MLRFLHVGTHAPDRVQARMVESTRRIVPEVEAGIERAWRTLAADRPGVLLFDGPMCRLESFSAAAGTLRLAFSPTSYKPFLGTNLSRRDLAETHGRDVMASPTGVSVALHTADGFLMFGRRNGRVAYYPHRLHPFAGAAEPTGPGRAGPPDVFADVARELREEVGLTAGDLESGSVRLIGLVEDTALLHPELIFRAATPYLREEIESRLDAAEHRGTRAVPATPAGVGAALADDDFTPVGRAAMLLWGRGAFGEDWFESKSTSR